MRGVFRHPLAQRIALGAAGLAILSVVAVQPAHSQFGIDIAAILAGLKAVNNTLPIVPMSLGSADSICRSSCCG